MIAMAYNTAEFDHVVLGATLALTGVGAWAVCVLLETFQKPAQGAEDAYELGQQMGYEKGYAEGRRVAKPVVVDLRPSRCPECRGHREGGGRRASSC